MSFFGSEKRATLEKQWEHRNQDWIKAQEEKKNKERIKIAAHKDLKKKLKKDYRKGLDHYFCKVCGDAKIKILPKMETLLHNVEEHEKGKKHKRNSKILKEMQP